MVGLVGSLHKLYHSFLNSMRRKFSPYQKMSKKFMLLPILFKHEKGVLCLFFLAFLSFAVGPYNIILDF